MQLGAAGCHCEQLSKTLMNNYNDLMNEDKWNNVQNKQQQKKKIKKNPNPSTYGPWGPICYPWPIRYFSVRQRYHTVHKMLTFSLASSVVYSNNRCQILDFGIKKAFACSCMKTGQNGKVDIFQHQQETQSWLVGSLLFWSRSSHASKSYGKKERNSHLVQCKRFALKSWQDLLS